MPLILGAQSAIGAADVVTNSCRFNDGDAVQLYRAVSVEGNRKVWTISFWFKKGNAVGCRLWAQGNTPSQNPSTMFELGASGAMTIFSYTGSYPFILEPSAKLKDPSAWYHLVVSFDSTPSTPSSSSIKFFINGTQQTAFSTETYPAQDFETEINNTTYDSYAAAYDGGNYFDGYMAEFCLIDGTAYDASDFGEFNTDSPTIWQPKDVSELTFGTNGFYLDFEDSSALGTDAAGSNNLTATNLAAVDQCIDTPVNNFATLNSVDNYYQAATFSEGNNTIVTGSDKYGPSTSTLGMSAGKWYWEVKPTARGGGNDYLIGVTSTQLQATTEELGHFPNDWAYYSSNGYYRNNNGTTSYGDSWDTDDIIGFALDLDNNKLYFSKTNVWQNSGDPTSGATGTGAISITAPASTPLGAYFAGVAYWDSGTATINANFGGCSAFALTSAESDENGYGNFEYEPPSGYLALCTKNLGSDGG